MSAIPERLPLFEVSDGDLALRRMLSEGLVKGLESKGGGVGVSRRKSHLTVGTK